MRNFGVGTAYPDGTAQVTAASPAGYPSYAPTNLKNNWDAPRAGYNCNPRTLHKPRAAAKKLLGGTSSMHVLGLGDSTLVGYNGTTFQYDYNVLRSFGKALARSLGVEFTTGLQTAVAAANSLADNCAVTGGFVTNLNNFPHFATGFGAGTYTWRSMDPCTAVEFYVSDVSISGFTYQIDGGTATAVTTTGATAVRKVSVTGLTKGIHTITINGVASQFVFVMAFRGWDPNVQQLQVHDLAIGGSQAYTATLAGQNWSDNTTVASGAGLAWVMNQIVVQSGITMDWLLISCGNNDHFQSIAATNIITGLTTMRNYYSTVPAMFIHPPMVAGGNATTFADFSGKLMTLADTLDVPLLDWNYLDSGQASYAADGLVGADGNHPINGEQVAVGRVLCDLFSDMYAPQPSPLGLAQTLASDLAIPATTATTLFTTPSLAPGTYFVTCNVTMVCGATLGSGDMRIRAGTATATVAGQSALTFRANATNQPTSAALSCVVTVTAPGTLVVEAFTAQAFTMKAATLAGGAYTGASGLTLLKIA